MNRGIFTILTRRASLIALGAAGLAALQPPVTTSARKKRKKNRNNGNGDALKRCKKQVQQCLSVLTPDCAGNPGCLAALELCCPELGTCDLDGFFFCIDSATQSQTLRPR